ncbi:LysR family transcriptional regulator [Diaphorobacter sp. HDW4A]|uniref:LysR family transcriptional regulator n=1 Tax=Diaphorobacter sp. HDW4A TaxID=2714924 RepID=UPI001408C36B|nr:LysR family transcriptional regulator [Diaphorobacter sp. HDW4A]QIL82772.1 LysR family transcriptional regulator [Diaphorobacter sp. HDW4A]
MELRQLEAFAAVMSTGSVTAAGRVLGRSQPAVTRLVQELEAEIGYPLFSRNGPRVSPTEQAFLLFEDVEHALQSLQQIRRRAKEIEHGVKRPLHLLATSALAAGLIPAALARLEASGNDAAASQIHLRSASPERVAHGVLTGSAQLGVTSLPLEHRGLQVHWIAEAPCVAVLPAGDPLATRDVVPLAALAQRRLITMANPYRLLGRLDDAFAAVSTADEAAARQFLKTNSSVNAMAAVRARLGVSVLEPVTALGLPLDGLAVRALDTHIPFLFGVVSQQTSPFTPAMDALCNALADAAAALLPGFVLHDASRHAELLLQHALPMPAKPAGAHPFPEQEEESPQ